MWVLFSNQEKALTDHRGKTRSNHNPKWSIPNIYDPLPIRYTQFLSKWSTITSYNERPNLNTGNLRHDGRCTERTESWQKTNRVSPKHRCGLAICATLLCISTRGSFFLRLTRGRYYIVIPCNTWMYFHVSHMETIGVSWISTCWNSTHIFMMKWNFRKHGN